MGTWNIELQPFVDEINTKEGDIAKYAGAATMQRVKGMIFLYCVECNNITKSNADILAEIKGELRDITAQLNGWY